MVSSWWAIIVPAVGTMAVIISTRHSAKLARDLAIRIEKHRADPSFPLEVPPSKFRIFLREYGWQWTAVLVNVGLLVYWLSHPVPYTREVSANLVVLTISTSWMLSDLYQFSIRRRVFDILLEMSETDRLLGEQTGNVVDVVQTLVTKLQKPGPPK